MSNSDRLFIRAFAGNRPKTRTEVAAAQALTPASPAKKSNIIRTPARNTSRVIRKPHFMQRKVMASSAVAADDTTTEASAPTPTTPKPINSQLQAQPQPNTQPVYSAAPVGSSQPMVSQPRTTVATQQATVSGNASTGPVSPKPVRTVRQPVDQQAVSYMPTSIPSVSHAISFPVELFSIPDTNSQTESQSAPELIAESHELRFDSPENSGAVQTMNSSAAEAVDADLPTASLLEIFNSSITTMDAAFPVREATETSNTKIRISPVSEPQIESGPHFTMPAPEIREPEPMAEAPAQISLPTAEPEDRAIAATSQPVELGTDAFATQQAEFGSLPAFANDAVMAPPETHVEGWIPAWQVEAFRIPSVCELVQHAAKETLNELSGRLIAATGVGQNVVSIRSAWRGVGRTTMTIGLAAWLARVGIRTCIVDADFEHPRLANQLGLEIEQGWEQVLDQDCDIAELCVVSAEDGFCVAPLAQPMDANETVKDVICNICDSLSRNFDLVLIDCGPGADIWERHIAAKQLGVLAVQDARRRHQDELSVLVDTLQRLQVRMLGVIANFESLQ
ncbi:MAG: AAA family ATPase [Planctomycetales bacterium]|nr:AAA family ATPase [Planctomycetales bacterium]